MEAHLGPALADRWRVLVQGPVEPVVAAAKRPAGLATAVLAVSSHWLVRAPVRPVEAVAMLPVGAVLAAVQGPVADSVESAVRVPVDPDHALAHFHARQILA